MIIWLFCGYLVFFCKNIPVDSIVNSFLEPRDCCMLSLGPHATRISFQLNYHEKKLTRMTNSVCSM